MRYVRPVTIPRDAGYVAVRRARCNTYGIVWSIVGLIWITPTLLWIETDSKRRGDTLRRRVEAACGSDVTHAPVTTWILGREHAWKSRAGSPGLVLARTRRRVLGDEGGPLFVLARQGTVFSEREETPGLRPH